MQNHRPSTFLLGIFMLWMISFPLPYAASQTQPSFAQANTAIQNAYASMYQAQISGGNVSALVPELNNAILLLSKAENETAANNTAAASADFASATNIANSVSSEAQTIGRSASLAHTYQVVEALSETATIVIVTLFIYFFGGRIYRRIWFYLFKDYVVKPSKNG